ncbi:VWA domain-containing protein [soil metagenome]
MGSRHTYSRWDGTQQVDDFDDLDVLDALSDDVIEHGDVNAALRRLMNDGLQGPDGRRLAGLRELLERLRAARQERLDRYDPAGVYDEIRRELDDIVDEERHAIDRDGSGGDATERLLELDLLPDDLAGKVAALQQHPFTSSEAERRFENLLDRLREKMATAAFEQMRGAMSGASEEAHAEAKDMMAALNEMLERRQRGEDPGFASFMERFGHHFPGSPATLDELLAQMAARMAAMQSLLNSMSPEQRQQLQELSEQLLGDLDLRWQMEQLSANLQALVPDAGWGNTHDFRGDDPLGLGDAMSAMAELGELDQLEQMLRGVTSPAALAEIDAERVGELLGDHATDALERLAELSRRLAEAGLIEQTETGMRLTPRGMRSIGDKALRDVFAGLAQDQLGQHRVVQPGPGHEAMDESRPYEFGDPFRLDLQRTLRNAMLRRSAEGSAGLPVRLAPDDFEIERTEHESRAATVLMLDLSMSMPMEGRFVPAKKVAMALQALITSQFPHDYLGVVVFSETARVIRGEQIPEASWDYVYGTNMHHAFTLARQLLSRQHGSRQIIMITDGEPTAHITPGGEVAFHYPPVRETIEATLLEVGRCTRADIRINTFMLGASPSLKGFVERLTEINHGRAFFTTPEDLGDYVLVDFIEHRRRARRRH